MFVCVWCKLDDAVDLVYADPEDEDEEDEEEEEVEVEEAEADVVATTFARFVGREFEFEVGVDVAVEDLMESDERHAEEVFVLPELLLLFEGPLLLVKFGESSLIGGVGMP